MEMYSLEAGHGASSRLCYNSSRLQSLNLGCLALPRKIRRLIFSLGIRNNQHKCSASRQIRVRITRRKPSVVVFSPRQCCLQPVKRVNQARRQKFPRGLASEPSILLSNLRSVSNKIDEVSLKVSMLRPSVAVFTESWLDASVPDSALSIDGYSIGRKDRCRNGGGIISYVHQRYNFRILSVSEVPSLGSCETEFLPILFTNFPFFIIGVYHPFWNDSSRNEKCIACLSDLIDFVMVTTTFDPSKLRLAVCGDFNGLHHHVDEISQVMQLKPVVISPTRGLNILDQIFVNYCQKCIPEVLPPIGKSDHAVIFWKSVVHSPRSSVRKVVTRKFSAARKEVFAQLLARTDWYELVRSANDLDSCASLFTTSLFCVYDFCFPKRTVRLRSTDPPWMMPSLKILIDDRDRAYSKGSHRKYLRLRQDVVRHTRELKQKYLESALAAKNPRKSWNSLRLLGRFKRSMGCEFPVEVLNSYFCSNFQNDVSQLSVPSDVITSSPLSVSCSEVGMLLRKLKNKSPGPDGIPAWLLRDFADILSPAITFIFNWSLSTSHVPACFKFANVTPIPKCSSPSVPSDFRPISLLPILSKVLEKIVARNWILPTLSAKSHASQYAYLPGAGNGTTNALTLLQHEILTFLDASSGSVRVLSVDFAKAFDKILHSGVLATASKFKLSEEAIAWIASFLSDRYQRVAINDKLSSWKIVSSGVPQGSVIGPLLFCMFVDDLNAISNNSSTFKYADDLTILHFIREPSDDKLQMEYDHVLSWSRSRCLPINESKCCVLNITTKKSLTNSTLLCPDGLSLPRVSSVSLLGVTMTDDLRWNVHINKMISKCSRRIYLLRNLKRSGCSPSLMLHAYNSLIRPILLYAYPSFCNLTKFLKDKLLRFERRIFRIVGEKNNISVIEAAEQTCERLFEKVCDFTEHPLRRCFSQRCTRTRASMKLRPVKAKTKRLSTSFIRFAR